MKFLFIILLLASTTLLSSTQESEDVEYDDNSFSASEFSFSQSASLSIFHRFPCVFRGRIIFHGEIWHIDSCIKCRCKNGTTLCEVESCETELLCQPDETVVEEGECCPYCQNSNPSSNCSLRGTTYQQKQQVYLDPCTLCTCEIHGNMKCHILSCPSRDECEPTEIVSHQDVCCPLCPYKLVVEGVRISHDKEYSLGEDPSNTVRFSVHVAANKKDSSNTVKGEQLWRLGAWISENKDGLGPRMFYQSNIFNEQHAAKSFHRQDTARFRWFGLKYRIEHGEDPPGSYLCVEFDKGKYPRPLYNLSLTVSPLAERREYLVGCMLIRTLTGLALEFGPDLKSDRFFQRNVGDSITFSCNVTNAHTVLWKHSSWAKTEIVTSKSTFRIDSITLEDQGSYYCIAKGHGKHVKSAKQVLILPDLAQFLLRIEVNTSSSSSQQEVGLYQQNIVSQMEKAHILANSINTSSDTNLTIYVGKELKSGQELDTTIDDIWKIIKQTRNSSSPNDSNIIFRLDGLSFCYNDLVVTEAGNLSFARVNVNSGAVSNEVCLVPGKLPRGTRRCDGDLVTAAVWKNVHINNCFTSSTKEKTDGLIDSYFEIMENRLVTGNNVTVVTIDLLDITTATTLRTEEITKMVPVLEQVSSANSTDPMVASNMLQVVDKIINAAAQMVSSEKLSPSTSSRILHSVELQLEHIQKSGINFSSSLPNIETRVVQVSNLNEPFSFTVCPLSTKRIQNVSKDLVNLTMVEQIPDCTKGASMDIPVAVMNFSFNGHNQKKVFPVTLTSYQSGVLFNDEKATKMNKILDSIIISASTSFKVENLPNTSFIRTSFAPLEVNDLQHSCVFWDYHLYKESGGWSSEGCHYKKVNDSHAHICECNHLTNFAVLMDEDLTNGMKNRVSEIFVLVGCVIAIIFLAVTICIYVAVRDLRNGMPYQITLNLFIAFLALYCCFLLGKGKTDLNPGCVIFGVFTHYFCITSVAWMTVEATFIYFFEFVTTQPGNILVPSLTIAWGLPFILVTLSATIATDSYAHGDYCLPSFSSVVFYISLLGVVSLLLTYNAVIYFLCSWKLKSINKNTTEFPHEKVSRRLQTSCLIFVLFGLSWLFGFLAIGGSSAMYGILFGLCSSLLGFCVFHQHCWRREAVHDAWRRLVLGKVGGRGQIDSDFQMHH